MQEQQKIFQIASFFYLLASAFFGISAVMHVLGHRYGLAVIFGFLAITFFSLGIVYRVKVNHDKHLR